MRCQALLAALLTGVSAVAQQQVPAPRAVLPADWDQRDLEGKWVVYRRAVDDSTDQKAASAAWVSALGAHGELELLEWLAIFEGSSGALSALDAAGAPQFVRAAVWNLGNFDSHGQELATKLLLARAERVRGWLAANPGLDGAEVQALRNRLAAAGDAAAADPNDLPALDPMQALVPWLDAPAELAHFGEAITAAPKVRYVHQVLRALRGVLVHGDAGDLVIAKVIRLTAHADAAVRHAAFDTLSKLPPAFVPLEPMLRIVDDAGQEAARRRLAAMVASFSSHPRAQRELVRLALDAAHPANEVALTRLGEVGDPVGVEPIREAVEALPPAGKAPLYRLLGAIDRRQRDRAFAHAIPLRALLQRVAWLRVTGDPGAGRVQQATVALLRSQTSDLGRLLGELATAPVPPSPFRGDEAGRVDREIALLIEELRAPPPAAK